MRPAVHNRRVPPRVRIHHCLVLAGAALLVVAAAAVARGQVTADRGVSILVFPKIIADGSGDTAIEVANVWESPANAVCAYVGGGPDQWQAVSFGIALGARRPQHWTVARGRTAAPREPPLDVPAAPDGFRGALLCIEVDQTGAPLSGNALAGQATLLDIATGDVRGYGGVGLQGSGLNDGDPFLCIGGEPSDACVLGAEYDACPGEWIVSVPADGAADAPLGAGVRYAGRVTVLPCSQDLRGGAPATVELEITVIDQLGQQFSGNASATCWSDLALADVGAGIFDRATLGSDWAEARIRPAEGSGGFLLVAETTRGAAGAAPIAATTTVVPHSRGAATEPDLIVMPAGALP
jgi:hypothetical protein